MHFFFAFRKKKYYDELNKNSRDMINCQRRVYIKCRERRGSKSYGIYTARNVERVREEGNSSHMVKIKSITAGFYIGKKLKYNEQFLPAKNYVWCLDLSCALNLSVMSLVGWPIARFFHHVFLYFKLLYCTCFCTRRWSKHIAPN